MATIKSGFLQKLSGLLKRDWKRRYFVLYQDGELVYYETPNSQICDGKVNVRQTCQRIDYGFEVEHDIQQKASGRVNCLFSIRSSVKNVTLLGDTEQDAREWVQKLNEVRQSSMPFGTAPGFQQAGTTYPSYQPGMPYPTAQPGMQYPPNQPGMGYPPNPSHSVPYPTQGGMPQPYPMGATYPGQPPPYGQPMPPQPVPMYGQYPSYQAQPPPGGGYGYPAYQQQYQQTPQNRGNFSSRRGLLAGAAGGALAGGLLGFGMGHAIGGMGDSFDSDCCGFDCD